MELAGISFGAYLAAVPAALDPRVKRLWLIHGSGDPAAVLEAGLRKRIPWSVFASGLGLAAGHRRRRAPPEPRVPGGALCPTVPGRGQCQG